MTSIPLEPEGLFARVDIRLTSMTMYICRCLRLVSLWNLWSFALVSLVINEVFKDQSLLVFEFLC